MRYTIYRNRGSFRIRDNHEEKTMPDVYSCYADALSAVRSFEKQPQYNKQTS